MKRGCLVVFILVCTFVSASELSELAESMQPGDWAELDTIDLYDAVNQEEGGATHSIFPYSEDGKWDPITRRFFFIGGDHIYNQSPQSRIISYSEENNTWQTEPKAYWMNSGFFHGYDHTAYNPEGYLYHRPFSSEMVYIYNLLDDSWDELAPMGVGDNGFSCCAGVEYFPGLGLVMIGWNQVWIYDDGWNMVSEDHSMGDYHNFAEYNPVHNVLIFGGGNDNKEMYKLDSNGSVTKLGDMPYPVRVNDAIATVDPVSGNYLFFFGGGPGYFYIYDVLDDDWQLQSSDIPLFIYKTEESDDPEIDLTIAGPVNTHGVVMFVQHTPFYNATVLLYKHAPDAYSCTTLSELSIVINQWKLGDVSIIFLMNSIADWKNC